MAQFPDDYTQKLTPVAWDKILLADSADNDIIKYWLYEDFQWPIWPAWAWVVWRWAYSWATAYVVNDAVSYLWSSYICILATTGNLPTNVTYWEVLAAKGTDGAGSGDMLKSTYDPGNVNGSAFDMENMTEWATKKILTTAERTKLTNTSGTNTGDQTTITGNAGTATALATARTINGVSFDGTANITVPSDITPWTSGNVLTSNGSVWTSSAPSGGGWADWGGNTYIWNLVAPSTYKICPFQANWLATSTVTTGVDRVYYIPIMMSKTVTITEISYNITGVPTAGYSKIWIYTDSSGRPNTKILSSWSISNASTGVKTETVSWSLTGGTLYWLAFCPWAVVWGWGTFKSIAIWWLQSMLWSDITGTNAATHYYETLTSWWTNLPATASWSLTTGTGGLPAVYFIF